MEFVVRLKGKQESILNDFVNKGYYNTKSETMRAGLLSLAEKHKIEDKPSLEEVTLLNKAIKHEMKKIKDGKTKLHSEKEFQKRFGYLKE